MKAPEKSIRKNILANSLSVFFIGYWFYSQYAQNAIHYLKHLTKIVYIM